MKGLTDNMLMAEAQLTRDFRRRLRARPRYRWGREFSMVEIAERMKLAGLAQAIRAIRRARR